LLRPQSAKIGKEPGSELQLRARFALDRHHLLGVIGAAAVFAGATLLLVVRRRRQFPA
jgi:uncharacterized membrane protein